MILIYCDIVYCLKEMGILTYILLTLKLPKRVLYLPVVLFTCGFILFTGFYFISVMFLYSVPVDLP